MTTHHINNTYINSKYTIYTNIIQHTYMHKYIHSYIYIHTVLKTFSGPGYLRSEDGVV